MPGYFGSFFGSGSIVVTPDPVQGSEIKAVLLAHLLDSPAVEDAVDDRVAWGELPRGAVLPYIGLRLNDAPRDYVMTGASGLVTSRVEISCWATTAISARDVAAAVRASINGLRQDFGDIEIQGAFIDFQDDFIDTEAQPPNELAHCCRLDFSIWHTE